MFFDHRDPPQVVRFPPSPSPRGPAPEITGHMVPIDAEPMREPLARALAAMPVICSPTHVLTLRADEAPDLEVFPGMMIGYGDRYWFVRAGYDPWETIDHVDYAGLRAELERIHRGKPNAARLVDDGIRSRQEHHARQRGKWLKLLVAEAR